MMWPKIEDETERFRPRARRIDPRHRDRLPDDRHVRRRGCSWRATRAGRGALQAGRHARVPEALLDRDRRAGAAVCARAAWSTCTRRPRSSSTSSARASSAGSPRDAVGAPPNRLRWRAAKSVRRGPSSPATCPRAPGGHRGAAPAKPATSRMGFVAQPLHCRGDPLAQRHHATRHHRDRERRGARDALAGLPPRRRGDGARRGARPMSRPADDAAAEHRAGGVPQTRLAPVPPRLLRADAGAAGGAAHPHQGSRFSHRYVWEGGPGLSDSGTASFDNDSTDYFPGVTMLQNESAAGGDAARREHADAGAAERPDARLLQLRSHRAEHLAAPARAGHRGQRHREHGGGPQREQRLPPDRR